MEGAKVPLAMYCDVSSRHWCSKVSVLFSKFLYLLPLPPNFVILAFRQSSSQVLIYCMGFRNNSAGGFWSMCCIHIMSHLSKDADAEIGMYN